MTHAALQRFIRFAFERRHRTGRLLQPASRAGVGRVGLTRTTVARGNAHDLHFLHTGPASTHYLMWLPRRDAVALIREGPVGHVDVVATGRAAVVEFEALDPELDGLVDAYGLDILL